VVRKVNGERVLRPSEGEYMDRGVHAVLGSVNRMHVQLARDGRNCGSWEALATSSTESGITVNDAITASARPTTMVGN